MKKYLFHLALLAAICIAGCKKDDNTTPEPLPTPPAKWNFSFMLDGTGKQWQEDNSNWFAGRGERGWSNTADTFYFTNAVSLGSAAGPERLEAEKGRIISSSSHPSFAQRVVLFAPDSAVYSDSSWAHDGVIVRYTDPAGKIWSSDRGSQTGSWFYISDNSRTTFNYFNILSFTANFACKVYDGQGNVKQITNAVIKSSISSAD